MKKLLIVLAFLLIPLVGEAQTISTTTCPGAGCVDVTVAGQGSLGIQITGTWSGTISFQASVGTSSSASTFVAINVQPSNSTTAVSSTTANGLWSASVSGLNLVRIVFTAYSSGTANVTFRVNNQARAFGPGSGGGGGGGGTPGGATLSLQYNNAGALGGGDATPATVQEIIYTYNNLPFVSMVHTQTSTGTIGNDGAITPTISVQTTTNPSADDPTFTSYEAIDVYNTVPVTNSKNIFWVSGMNSGVTWSGANGITNTTQALGLYSSSHNTTPVYSVHGAGFEAFGSANTHFTDAIYTTIFQTAGTVVLASNVPARGVFYGGSTITEYDPFYVYTPNVSGGATIATVNAFYSQALGGTATNAYGLWLDEAGVYRIRADNTFNSVYQAIPTLYNPQFTKYTPGATNFERCIPGCQWESNVAVITTEAGGTGTLRAMRIGDTGTTVTITSPTVTPAMTITEGVGSSALTLTGATQTASFPVLTATQTWNASGTTFTAIKLNVTNTASASASLLSDLQVGSSSIFSVRKDGLVQTVINGGIAYSILVSGQNPVGFGRNNSVPGMSIHGGGSASPSDGNAMVLFTGSGGNTPSIVMDSTAKLGWANAAVTQALDVILARDTAQTLAQRNGTNAQVFNIYNTYTSATNNEYFNLLWSSNVLHLGANKGSGGGTARVMQLDYGGTTTAAISVPITSGNVSITGFTNTAGQFYTSITSVQTSNYTVLSTDVTVRCDTSGGGFTVTLPAASGVVGQIVNVKLVTAGNTLTIGRTGSDTIDGATSLTTSVAGTNFQLQAAASGLWIIL